jgi:hypothetical protein
VHLIAGGGAMRRLSMPLVAASLALAGCTILHSSRDETASGIPYYLPKSLIVAEVKLNRKADHLDSKGDPVGPYTYSLEFDESKEGTVSKTRGDAIPDPNHRFFLTYHNNPLYNDRYCISTDPNNLLTSIEYATEDATPRIALALAQLARRGPQAFAAQPQFEVYKTMKVTFNPYDRTESRAAEKAIINALPDDVPPSFRNLKFHLPGLARFKGEPAVTCRSDRGVCFRTKVKVPMLLTDGSVSETGGQGLTPTVMVDVVNVYHTGNFDLDRTFMVEKVVRLGFEQGALTQVIMRKPSEALETVKLPLAIVDAILAVPANFVDKAGDGAKVRTALADQQKTIDEIQNQLKTGLDATGTFNAAPYTEKCVGNLKTN